MPALTVNNAVLWTIVAAHAPSTNADFVKEVFRKVVEADSAVLDAVVQHHNYRQGGPLGADALATHWPAIRAGS